MKGGTGWKPKADTLAADRGLKWRAIHKKAEPVTEDVFFSC